MIALGTRSSLASSQAPAALGLFVKNLSSELLPSACLVDRVPCHVQDRSARSRDTGAHNGRAPLRLPSLVMGDREVCAPTVWASSHWSACLEVGGEPSPCSFGNADQQCRCIVAYPRLRVFPLAWFSVMPGLMTSHLTVCWFSVVCQIMLSAGSCHMGDGSVNALLP